MTMTDNGPTTDSTTFIDNVPADDMSQAIARQVAENMERANAFLFRTGDAAEDNADNTTPTPTVLEAVPQEATEPVVEVGDGGTAHDTLDSTPPESVLPVTPASYTVTYDGQEITLHDDDLQRLIALNQWGTSLSPEVREQFGLIEQGRAVALPADEYAAYQAYRALQAQRQTPAYLQPPTAPDLNDLDDDTRAYILQVQAERDQAAATANTYQEQLVQAAVPQHNQAIEARAALIDEAMGKYATANGLDEATVSQLMNTAVQAGVITSIAHSQQHYSPSGVLVQDADWERVTEMALNFGRLSRPDLLTSIPAPVSPVTSPPAPTPTPADTHVANKKAFASSLASAPSAATTPPAMDPRNLAPQDQRAVIAQLLREQTDAR